MFTTVSDSEQLMCTILFVNLCLMQRTLARHSIGTRSLSIEFGCPSQSELQLSAVGDSWQLSLKGFGPPMPAGNSHPPNRVLKRQP